MWSELFIVHEIARKARSIRAACEVCRVLRRVVSSVMCDCGMESDQMRSE